MSRHAYIGSLLIIFYKPSTSCFALQEREAKGWSLFSHKVANDNRVAMIDKARIESIIEVFMADREGLYLLRAEVKGANRIEVEIDHDHEPIGIDLIVELTKFIEERLNRDEEDFDLEVSSAGLTSPLTIPRRYRKFIGKELELLLRSGRKEIGTLLSVTDEHITLEVTKVLKPEGEKRKRPVTSEVEVKYEEINRATYHLQF